MHMYCHVQAVGFVKLNCLGIKLSFLLSVFVSSSHTVNKCPIAS
jgi:hypothetical protein